MASLAPPPSLSPVPFTPEDLYELEAMDEWLETQAELADVESAMKRYFLPRPTRQPPPRVVARNQNRGTVLRSLRKQPIVHDKLPYLEKAQAKRPASNHHRTGLNGQYVQTPRKSNFATIKH
ncbi:hypothetical protein BASA81_002795 [Batrachochytrium salamandrivorans]|nr:hypothetical protein BASA81_002795 [Batrachochytrium salamandrivorans]